MLTIEEFRAWLSSFEERAVVGRACDEERCPLAYYLNDKTGGRASVGPSLFCVETSDGFYNFDEEAGRLQRNRPVWYYLPPWAHWFVRFIDARRKGTRITAKRALEILEHVERFLYHP